MNISNVKGVYGVEYTTSYKVKLRHVSCPNALQHTIKYYRSAVSYLVKVVQENWNTVTYLKLKEKNNFIEHLVHTTKHHTASYDFDLLFPKFPSYLRRSAIMDAIGIVTAYQTNLINYKKERDLAISNGKIFRTKPPKLRTKHFKCPAFYKGNMYKKITNRTAQIKVYLNHDWVWTTVHFSSQDVKYIQKYCMDLKEMSPILVHKGNSFYLQFSYKGKSTFSDKTLKERMIVSVDLGINHSAVCSLMSYNGTVLKRIFINQKREKDHLNHLINRLKRKQQEGGRKATNKALRAKMNGLNQAIVNDTVHKILEFAITNHADVVVFEYLNFMGTKVKGKNNLSTRLQLWAKRKIQTKVLDKAHSVGIRVERVNAQNTSSLAYDGSGKIKRNKDCASLCVFKNGKQYHTDLSASYNIGARYFIREIEKTTSAKKWSQMVAKVPSLRARTQCTLSTLISLVAVV